MTTTVTKRQEVEVDVTQRKILPLIFLGSDEDRQNKE